MDHFRKKAFVKLTALLIILVFWLFIPAGPVQYRQAWVFLVAFYPFARDHVLPVEKEHRFIANTRCR
jgi:hypothetical protein